MKMHKENNFADTVERLRNEGFICSQRELNGSKCWLITPANMGVEWNKDNLIYRSSVWTMDGHPISLSWKKFFNWDEKCDLVPKPKTIEECTIVTKEDGSTLLVSMYEGNLVMRTRGTTDIRDLDNGFEYDFLLKKYSEFFDMVKQYKTSPVTWVFEWVTPNNKIVIDYGAEPKIILTGVITHDDYSYFKNYELDRIADDMVLERPKTYSFASLDEMSSAVKAFKGTEGVCCYFNDEQDIKKMKADEYLMLHSVKFKLGYKALVSMIFEQNLKLDDFKAYIERAFDHEGLKFVEAKIEDVYKLDLEIKNGIMDVYNFMIEKFNPQTKKELAGLIFGNSHPLAVDFSGFLFKLYEAEEKDVRELLMVNEGLCRKFKDMILERLKDDQNEQDDEG